tara:strand:- start:1558 stop:1818 length:261 start_codon:yes stop_codon:yes gene_type:complete
MQKYLVEFIGTLFFLFTILATGNPLAIVASLYIAIVVGGHISGGHFNPAVSIMMAFMGKLSKKDLPLYLLAQILGGLSAWYIFTIV